MMSVATTPENAWPCCVEALSSVCVIRTGIVVPEAIVTVRNAGGGGVAGAAGATGAFEVDLPSSENVSLPATLGTQSVTLSFTLTRQ